MIFCSKFIRLPEASNIVRERTSLPPSAADPLMQALEEGALQAEAIQDGKWSPLPAKWWYLAPIDWYPRLSSRTGRLYAFEIRVARKDLDRLWPEKTIQDGPMSRGEGRPPSQLWDRVFIEAACHILTDGLPKTQASLIEAVQLRIGDGAPQDTQMKMRLGPFYRAVKSALTHKE